MLPNVVTAQVTGPYTLRLRFNDGLEGELDISSFVTFKGVFASLRDPVEFGKVRVDPELGTVVWPSGADLDPDVLHERVASQVQGDRRP